MLPNGTNYKTNNFKISCRNDHIDNASRYNGHTKQSWLGVLREGFLSVREKPLISQPAER